MNEIMEKVKYGILDLFPRSGRCRSRQRCAWSHSQLRLHGRRQPADVPGGKFPLKVSLDMLAAEMPLGELVAYIGRYVKSKN